MRPLLHQQHPQTSLTTHHKSGIYFPLHQRQTTRSTNAGKAITGIPDNRRQRPIIFYKSMIFIIKTALGFHLIVSRNGTLYHGNRFQQRLRRA